MEATLHTHHFILIQKAGSDARPTVMECTAGDAARIYTDYQRACLALGRAVDMGEGIRHTDRAAFHRTHATPDPAPGLFAQLVAHVAAVKVARRTAASRKAVA